MCGSPKLIAACHVLHRLFLPRHPPCALSSLTIEFTRTQQSNYLCNSQAIYFVHSPRPSICLFQDSIFGTKYSKDTQHCYSFLWKPPRYSLLSLVVIYPIYSVVKNRRAKPHRCVVACAPSGGSSIPAQGSSSVIAEPQPQVDIT